MELGSSLLRKYAKKKPRVPETPVLPPPLPTARLSLVPTRQEFENLFAAIRKAYGMEPDAKTRPCSPPRTTHARKTRSPKSKTGGDDANFQTLPSLASTQSSSRPAKFPASTQVSDLSGTQDIRQQLQHQQSQPLQSQESQFHLQQPQPLQQQSIPRLSFAIQLEPDAPSREQPGDSGSAPVLSARSIVHVNGVSEVRLLGEAEIHAFLYAPTKVMADEKPPDERPLSQQEARLFGLEFGADINDPKEREKVAVFRQLLEERRQLQQQQELLEEKLRCASPLRLSTVPPAGGRPRSASSSPSRPASRPISPAEAAGTTRTRKGQGGGGGARPRVVAMAADMNTPLFSLEAMPAIKKYDQRKSRLSQARMRTISSQPQLAGKPQQQKQVNPSGENAPPTPTQTQRPQSSNKPQTPTHKNTNNNNKTESAPHNLGATSSTVVTRDALAAHSRSVSASPDRCVSPKYRMAVLRSMTAEQRMELHSRERVLKAKAQLEEALAAEVRDRVVSRDRSHLRSLKQREDYEKLYMLAQQNSTMRAQQQQAKQIELQQTAEEQRLSALLAKQKLKERHLEARERELREARELREKRRLEMAARVLEQKHKLEDSRGQLYMDRLEEKKKQEEMKAQRLQEQQRARLELHRELTTTRSAETLLRREQKQKRLEKTQRRRAAAKAVKEARRKLDEVQRSAEPRGGRGGGGGLLSGLISPPPTSPPPLPRTAAKSRPATSATPNVLHKSTPHKLASPERPPSPQRERSAAPSPHEQKPPASLSTTTTSDLFPLIPRSASALADALLSAGISEPKQPKTHRTRDRAGKSPKPKDSPFLDSRVGTDALIEVGSRSPSPPKMRFPSMMDRSSAPPPQAPATLLGSTTRSEVADVVASAAGGKAPPTRLPNGYMLLRDALSVLAACRSRADFVIHPGVKELQLSCEPAGAPIGDSGAIQLANALAYGNPKQRALQKLVLSGHEIGDAGAKALAVVLSKITTLATLDLTSNKISDAGALALSGTTRVNPNLSWINLVDNPISPAMKDRIFAHYE